MKNQKEKQVINYFLTVYRNTGDRLKAEREVYKHFGNKLYFQIHFLLKNIWI